MDRGLMPSVRMATRIHDVPNLEEARERALLTRARSTDPADDSRTALTELWMSHGKLVAAIAARHRRSDIDHDDLINAGHLGLHTAIMRFDTERFDTRLAAYAAVWIRCHIQDYIRRNTGPVRLPESKGHRQLAQSASKLLAEARKACAREGVDPTDTELHERIGHRIGLSAAEVATGLHHLRGARASLGPQDGTGEPETGLQDETAPTADDMIQRLDHDRLRTRLHALANEILGERERLLFLTRCMADTDQVPSLETFAARFGVTPVRVHQIEVSARRKIAAALASVGYADYAGEGVVSPFTRVRARRTPAPPTRHGLVSHEKDKVFPLHPAHAFKDRATLRTAAE